MDAGADGVCREEKSERRVRSCWQSTVRVSILERARSSFAAIPFFDLFFFFPSLPSFTSFSLLNGRITDLLTC